MKNVFYLFLLSIVFSFQVFSQPASSSYSKRKPFKNFKSLQEFFSKDHNPNLPIIMAHRGGTGKGLPENSMITFKNTYAHLPAALLEMDLQPTSDNVLMIFHDDSVNRVTNGNGLLKSMSFKETRELRLKDAQGNVTDETIPTFQEVLDWNKNKALLVLDIKPGTEIRDVLQMVRKAKATNNCIFILYSIADAQKVFETNKDLMFAIGFNSKEGIEAIQKSGLPFDHLVALTPRQEQETSFYNSIHALGILCSRDEGNALKASGDENRKTLYRQMPKTGTDIIVTLDPLFVGKIFK